MGLQLHNLRCIRLCAGLMCKDPQSLWVCCSADASHYEIWEHCHSTSKVQAQLLQNLRVHLRGPVRLLEPAAGHTRYCRKGCFLGGSPTAICCHLICWPYASCCCQ